MLSRFALTYGLAVLSALSLVESRKEPEIKNLFVDADLFEAIEWVSIACRIFKLS
jgi:hypothetical protein